MIDADTVSVLAGGWSVRGLDLSRLPGEVIAVNDSAIYSTRIDVALSMDRLWTEHRWETIKQLGVVAWIRRSALQNIRDRPTWLFPFECDHESSTPSLDVSTLNGTNSGMCALNLALQGSVGRVLMFGFDMCVSPVDGAAYWYEPPWWQNGKRKTDKAYRDWRQQFAPLADAFAAAGVEVINASLSSAIPNFPKVDPRSVLL